MNKEWLLAGALCAVPFVILGLIEAAAMLQRRRQRTIARRPKYARSGRSGGLIGRAD